MISWAAPRVAIRDVGYRRFRNDSRSLAASASDTRRTKSISARMSAVKSGVISISGEYRTMAETPHVPCWWCGEVRHRPDLRNVDDRWLCREGVDDCIAEYNADHQPKPVPKFQHG